ncbi:uncharacterized protein [Blastocystis hominis]|uniref:Copine C-terminal domain-containing protein n=1 Tax=Blastocystis hominis TaxID=12968 RepID=D8LY25_BLAHO|nr:uncharacterized protein [Blastocystis hominis]CBK20480.2 unnamed protein product [Blastocystis hominis]|eukprot:XP_012894528.1 uncharacterized protein [Blastocystis hominis]
MGESDFHFMEILDGDMKKLEYNGNMVQFVSFEELRNKSYEEIVESLLFELPRQFMDYMNANNLSPNTIRDS